MHNRVLAIPILVHVQLQKQVESSFRRTNLIHSSFSIIVSKLIKFIERNDILSLSTERVIELARIKIK